MTLTAANWLRTKTDWHLIGSPLRPSATDIALFNQALRQWQTDFDSPTARILLLGVTPELRAMDWQPDSELLACDISSAMIDMLWPGSAFPGNHETPVRADWRALPLKTGSRNLVIGDGSLTLLGPSDLHALMLDLDRILDVDAALILRLFIRPERPESAENVVAAAFSGQIGNCNVFKWRFAMALQGNAATGIRTASILDAFNSFFPDRQLLSKETGWPLEVINTFDAYRESKVTFYFHRLDEICDILQPTFRTVSIDYPGYEMGERCPVITAYRIKQRSRFAK